MRILTVKEEEFCTYTGLFGCLITSASIIQHLVCYNIFGFLIPAVMLLFYLGSLFSFFILARQKWFAPVCLLVSTSLCLFNAAMAIGGPLISPLVVVHFIFSATLVAVMYIDGLPPRLRMKAVAVRAERDEWAGKI